MPQIAAAEKRLETAIARLETVLARRAGNPGASQRLDALKSDYVKLQDTAQAVSQRLDLAIARIETLLEA